MFNLSKQTRRTILLVLIMAMVPITIDGCAGSTGEKAKEKFEIVTLLGLGAVLASAGRRQQPLRLQQAA
ncbi:MAG: hypothetical protein JWR16_2817 [Nevskia sp.]|nr:hypothetical protein [Nevskia sp.]